MERPFPASCLAPSPASPSALGAVTQAYALLEQDAPPANLQGVVQELHALKLSIHPGKFDKRFKTR